MNLREYIKTKLNEDILDLSKNSGVFSIDNTEFVSQTEQTVILRALPEQNSIVLDAKNFGQLNELNKIGINQIVFMDPIDINNNVELHLSNLGIKTPVITTFYDEPIVFESCKIESEMWRDTSLRTELILKDSEMYIPNILMNNKFPSLDESSINCDIFYLWDPDISLNENIDLDIFDKLDVDYATKHRLETNLDNLSILKNEKFRFGRCIINTSEHSYPELAIVPESKSDWDKYILPHKTINRYDMESPAGTIMFLQDSSKIKETLISMWEKFHGV